MKIAIVHNDYGKFSGEEAVVRDHIALLERRGVQVVQFRRSSTELHGLPGAIKGFLSGIWNPVSQSRFGQFLEREQPDAVHIHNLYPLINPCVLQEAKKRHIPIVMTLHNFRLVCPNGLFAVNNAVCEECAQKHSALPCLRHNCEHSIFKSLGYALRTLTAQYFHWYKDNVDRYLCLTEFQRDKLISYGLPKEKCEIVPNFIDSEWLAKARQARGRSAGGYVVYMGRLSGEKGIDLVLAAAKMLPEILFRIAGNGADAYREGAPENVEFMGYVGGDEKFGVMRKAKIQIMASRWYECFPTTLLQGMSLGVPAVVPALGGMPWIIGDGGMAFVPGNAEDLCAKIIALWQNDAAHEVASQAAIRRVEEYFTPEIVGNQLLGVYHELCNS